MRRDDKTTADRLAFASFWLGVIGMCLMAWLAVLL
jgi:hypothetical protein